MVGTRFLIAGVGIYSKRRKLENPCGYTLELETSVRTHFTFTLIYMVTSRNIYIHIQIHTHCEIIENKYWSLSPVPDTMPATFVSS